LAKWVHRKEEEENNRFPYQSNRKFQGELINSGTTK